MRQGPDPDDPAFGGRGSSQDGVREDAPGRQRRAAFDLASPGTELSTELFIQ
jgi:hypothetical protein